MTVRKETGGDAKSKKLLFNQNITFSLGVTQIKDLPEEVNINFYYCYRSS